MRNDMLHAYLDGKCIHPSSALKRGHIDQYSCVACIYISPGIGKLSLLLQMTARHNFTHVMQQERRDSHTLIRHGIYRWSYLISPHLSALADVHKSLPLQSLQ